MIWAKCCLACLCWNYAGRPGRLSSFSPHPLTDCQYAAVARLTARVSECMLSNSSVFVARALSLEMNKKVLAYDGSE
eukprot:9745107-Karenia_brevis.AAC.1